MSKAQAATAAATEARYIQQQQRQCNTSKKISTSSSSKMDTVEDQPVLSEVHMETCPPNTTAWCTRFCYSSSEPGGTADGHHQPQKIAAQWHLHTSGTASEAAVSSTCCTGRSNDSAGSEAGMCVDDDGDLLLPHRPSRHNQYITIHHSLATPVSHCGEQVWLGACLLSDWLLLHQQKLIGKIVVELGAGVGLVSILAAKYAKQVYLTDGDAGALQLASKNVAVNAAHKQPEQLSNCSGQQQQGRIAVRRLDWLQLFDTQLTYLVDEDVLQLLNSNSSKSSSIGGICSGEAAASPHTFQVPMLACIEQQPAEPALQMQEQQDGSSYAWSASDLTCLAATQIWLAADVVYNETITDAFLRSAHQLMCWQYKQQLQLQRTCPGGALPWHGDMPRPVDLPRLYLALEKRYNFTYRDLDARASAFEHFTTYVLVRPDCADQQRQQDGNRVSQQMKTGCASGLHGSSAKPLFHGRRLSVQSIPQALVYDRSLDLELWELEPVLQG